MSFEELGWRSRAGAWKNEKNASETFILLQRGKRTIVQTTSAGGLSASASTGFSGWSMTRTSGGAAFSLPAFWG
jgi:hypothetical protein